MFTRGVPHRTWYAMPQVGRVRMDGVVRIETVNNIVQTWAIARPLSAPAPGGAPHYLAGCDTTNPPIDRGGMTALTPARPRVEMDPSNQATWQRPYRFTT